MKYPRLILAAGALAAALIAPSSASADVTVTVEWGTSQGNLKNIVGLNGWSATDPNVAGNSNYKSSLGSINPPLFRLHAAEILNASTHPKSWLNADGLTWNVSRIQAALNGLSPHVGGIIINIPKWPSAMASHSAKLPTGQHAAFASFCASLADIVRNQLGNTKVTHLEILNEVDNLYNGSADMTELMNLCIAARNEIRKKTTALTLIPAPWTQPYDADMDTFITKINKDLFSAFSYHNYCTSGTTTDLNTIYNNAEYIGQKANDIRNKLNALTNGTGIKLFIGENNIYANWTSDSLNYMRAHQGGVALALTWRGCMQRRVNGSISTDSLQIWNDADGTYGVMNPSSNYALRHTGRLLKELRERFSSGSERRTTSGASSMRPFAVINGTQRNVMVVNRGSTADLVDFAFTGTAPSVSGNATIIRLDANGINQSTFAYTAGQPPQNISVQANSVNLIYFP
jgi:hypothetical protein